MFKMARRFCLPVIILFCIVSNIFSLTVVNATLQINADDEFYAYINGALVFETQSINGTNWEHTYTIDVTPYLFCGDYVLAINYYDTLSSLLNLTYKLTMLLDDASTVIIYSDGINERQMLNGNFLNSTQTFPAGWNTPGYSDAGWVDPTFICTGQRITDTAFPSGYVPNVSPYSGCGVPTAGQSVLYREKFNILCPLVEITKTINKNVVNMGETITYCFNYNNTDAAPWTFNIWDTIPAVTDFVGCNNGCTAATFGSDVVVSWPTINAASGASGTVCMWVAVNRFPMRREDREFYVMPVNRSKDLEKLACAGLSP